MDGQWCLNTRVPGSAGGRPGGVGACCGQAVLFAAVFRSVAFAVVLRAGVALAVVFFAAVFLAAVVLAAVDFAAVDLAAVLRVAFAVVRLAGADLAPVFFAGAFAAVALAAVARVVVDFAGVDFAAALAGAIFGSFFDPFTTFLNSWPARNAGTEVFLTRTLSPVAGLRAVRAARSRRCVSCPRRDAWRAPRPAEPCSLLGPPRDRSRPLAPIMGER
jgi:hypothetical protein